MVLCTLIQQNHCKMIKIHETRRISCFFVISSAKKRVVSTEKQFFLNTLHDELSIYFDVSSPPQIESGVCLVGCDVFQLQIVEEDGDTKLSLRWMSENSRRIETEFCEECKTIELNGKMRNLVV